MQSFSYKLDSLMEKDTNFISGGCRFNSGCVMSVHFGRSLHYLLSNAPFWVWVFLDKGCGSPSQLQLHCVSLRPAPTFALGLHILSNRRGNIFYLCRILNPRLWILHTRYLHQLQSVMVVRFSDLGNCFREKVPIAKRESCHGYANFQVALIGKSLD